MGDFELSEAQRKEIVAVGGLLAHHIDAPAFGAACSDQRRLY